MYQGFAANSLRRRLCLWLLCASVLFGLAGAAGAFLVVRGAEEQVELAQNAAPQATKHVAVTQAGTAVPGGEHRIETGELGLRGIAPIVMSLLLLSLANALIVWRCLRPLDRLRSLAASIDLERPRPTRFADAPWELRPVVDAIDQLATRLLATGEAQRLFTRNAAHVLRTPIAAIRVQVANLNNGPVGQREERLAELQQGAERLALLASQLLDLANADGEAPGGVIVEVALRRIVYDVVAHLFPFAVERDVDLGAGRIQEVKVRASEADLRKLLDNIVDNAIRYSGAGAHVDVTVSRIDDLAVIEVTDDGPGMADWEIDQVFERFQRSEANQSPGSGLGLPIAKALVERYGGRITLNTRSLWTTGVIVRIELPALPNRASATGPDGRQQARASSDSNTCRRPDASPSDPGQSGFRR
ncbi:sensor histidine kinase [Paraburkholderia hospita]|uniref:histidine kinase n=1 Tax=Paraburkholderia hospita TaxID=169430 RepID=A0ABN0F802_9BURK|nr:HAMP domain-containing sensor histidine kinase [Paraburkholderia hospita]EIM94749.1 histidine kinase [Paraburkholderia hospita]OUL79434.1 two-component sensor histidine kinase [Paraburkholderia hospita]OUL85084.1 two-component sensor histidine kinase [Paraburkholderia hospita]OUL86752.1 two-component sensor histidine kinase [Paraburkholderia hospita]